MDFATALIVAALIVAVSMITVRVALQVRETYRTHPFIFTLKTTTEGR